MPNMSIFGEAKIENLPLKPRLYETPIFRHAAHLVVGTYVG
jgi:hypothetical protein